jgi:hypothetical protein
MYEPTKIVSAAILYFLMVFGVRFLLGPIRVFWLAPRFGETIAVLCEAPFILIAVILAARWLPYKLKLQPNLGSLAGMALGGLFLQQVADFAVGAFLRGITPVEQLAHLVTPAGLIYVALLFAFAAMPVLVGRHRATD